MNLSLTMSLSFEARGSLTSMTITFQSVSPSSRRAMMPSTLTCLTCPVYPTASPISHTSTGSLSPLALVSGCISLGSSHVWGNAP